MWTASSGVAIQLNLLESPSFTRYEVILLKYFKIEFELYSLTLHMGITEMTCLIFFPINLRLERSIVLSGRLSLIS